MDIFTTFGVLQKSSPFFKDLESKQQIGKENIIGKIKKILSVVHISIYD